MNGFKRFLPLLVLLVFALSFSVGIPTSAHAASPSVAAQSVAAAARTTSQPPPHMKRVNLAAPDGAWSCVVNIYAWQFNSSTMDAQGNVDCSEVMDAISMHITAWFWNGSTWLNEGQMGPQCNYSIKYNVWCPANGVYQWFNIQRGQIWGARMDACAAPLEGTPDCTQVVQQLNF